jgi:hypothetical protein
MEPFLTIDRYGNEYYDNNHSNCIGIVVLTSPNRTKYADQMAGGLYDGIHSE